MDEMLGKITRIYVAEPADDTFRHGLELKLNDDVALAPDDSISIEYPESRRLTVFVERVADGGSTLEVDAEVLPYGRFCFELRKAAPAVWVVELTEEHRELLAKMPAQIQKIGATRLQIIPPSAS